MDFKLSGALTLLLDNTQFLIIKFVFHAHWDFPSISAMFSEDSSYTINKRIFNHPLYLKQKNIDNITSPSGPHPRSRDPDIKDIKPPCLFGLKLDFRNYGPGRWVGMGAEDGFNASIIFLYGILK